VAIALRAAGTVTPDTTLVSAIAPPVGAGAVAGDLSVLFVAGKPFDTTITTPTGWVLLGLVTNGSTAAGTDTGSTFVACFVKEGAAVGAIPTLSMGSANSISAQINTYSKAATEVWDYSLFTSGSDTSSGTGFSATGAAGLNVAAGDWVLACHNTMTDAGTISALGISGMAGATLGTVTTRANVIQSTGLDSHFYNLDVPITAGSSNAAPVTTHTTTGADTGTAFFLRLRVGQLVKPGPLQMTQALDRANNW
jgi:hypothetical protein